MATDITKEETLEILTRSPTAIALRVLNDIERGLSEDITYTDPNTPFVSLIESNAIVQSDINVVHFNHLQKVYPKMAQTREQLYHAMTDEDFIGAFAYPSKVNLILAIPKDDLYRLAKTDANSNIKRFVIPEGTIYTAGEYTFMLPRQIDIRFTTTSGIQVIYGDSSLTDVFSFESNIVEYDIHKIYNKGVILELIKIVPEVYQLGVISKSDVASDTSGFNKSYPTNEQYFTTRVYTSNNGGSWIPLNVTHSKFNYDISKPTASVRVLDGSVNVVIPDIYFTKGLIGTTVMVEIFTTKGNIDFNMVEYGDGTSIKIGKPIGLYQSSYQTSAVSQLSSLTSQLVYGYGRPLGGTNMLSFSDLKERTIDHTLVRKRPISSVEVDARLVDFGYNVTLSSDVTTKRLFLASKALPISTYGSSKAYATTTVGTLSSSLENIKLNKHVIDNGRRVTILPSALFSVNGKSIGLVDGITVDKLNAMDTDLLINHLSENMYGVTPFYHVLDNTGTAFQYRTYQLDSPKVKSRTFVAMNEAAETIFSTTDIGIEFNEPNYTITVMAKPIGDFDEALIDKMFSQIGYTTADGSYYGTIDGTYIGVTDNGEYIWQFIITTKLDITVNNYLSVKGVRIKPTIFEDTYINLNTEFNILYAISDSTISKNSDMNNLIVTDKSDYVVITHEKATIEFGRYLKHLYNRSRTIKGANIYERYKDDVYETYTKDVFVLDKNGAPKFTIRNNNIIFEYAHRKGDNVLDDVGKKVILYKANDIKYDANNNPILLSDDVIDRTIDLLLINSIYRFATNDNDTNYYRSLGNTIVDYIDGAISAIGGKLDNGTDIQFYPSINYGEVTVRVGNEVEYNLPSGLLFNIKIALPENKYNSYEYRNVITSSITDVLLSEVSKRTVSIQSINNAIRSVLSDEVTGVSVSCATLSSLVPIYQLTNDSEYFTIARKLEKLSSGVTKCGFDINIDWLKQ